MRNENQRKLDLGGVSNKKEVKRISFTENIKEEERKKDKEVKLG